MRIRAILLGIWLGIAMTLVAVLPVLAQDKDKPETAWQAAITGQIQAFRDEDSAKALSFAGSSFKETFEDPSTFLGAISQLGYDALVHSVSHSFGAFEQFDDTHAMQIVNIVGPDQKLYEALYQMMMEPEGWRVEAVTMKQSEGLAI